MVATDRDRIPAWYVLDTMPKCVGNEPHGRTGRKDPGFLGNVFLENVVLNRAGELGGIESLPFGIGKIHRPDHCRWSINRHGSRSLFEVDASKQDFHIRQ